MAWPAGFRFVGHRRSVQTSTITVLMAPVKRRMTSRFTSWTGAPQTGHESGVDTRGPFEPFGGSSATVPRSGSGWCRFGAQ